MNLEFGSRAYGIRSRAVSPMSSAVTVTDAGVSSKSAKSKPGETNARDQGRTVGGGLCGLPFAAVDQILATGAELAHEVRHRRVSPSADSQPNRAAALPEPQLVRDHPVPGRPFTG